MGADEKEITFYSDNRGVRITSSRLMVPDMTYAMANITSVKTEEVYPSYSGVLVTLLVGFLLVVGGFKLSSWYVGLFGVLLVGLGGYWGWRLEPDYHLRISSSAGETSALSSKDRVYIGKVLHAINEAIIHRG